VLEGLLEYERAVGSVPEIAAARRRGEEYLLERGLFRRRSTSEVANPAFLKFAFPPRYHHDVLRALAFPFGESVGQPSRWNTLRALRVLRWYERARLEPTSPP
jgi:hypothetical protein